ncbi:uncharacterized protein [Ptychodera flava]|uniref:uncharacterized protein n=1 Tax=Ptychodera flava TaxID=63121 RepID=UPI00396A5C4A
MAADIVRSFLLNDDIHDWFTFEEFQNLFPSNCRDHQDVRLLYHAFNRQRRRLLQNITGHIETRYGENMQALELSLRSSQVKSIDDAIQHLSDIEDDLQEELDETQEEIKEMKGGLECFDKIISTIQKFDKLTKNLDHETLQDVSKLVKK